MGKAIRCSQCGKFRKREHIMGVDNGWQEVSGEHEAWTECLFCCSQSDRETFFKNIPKQEKEGE